MYIGCHKYQSLCDTYNPRWQHPPSSQCSGTDMVYYIYLLLSINVREYRRGNQLKRNWQHRVHKTKKNKSKTQCVLDISMHKQTQIIYSSLNTPPSGICDLRRFWRSCLGPLVYLFPKLLKLFGFPPFRLVQYYRFKCEF